MMHVAIGGLFEINAILSRGLMGVDPYTGQRFAKADELPVGIFRHLRRLHRAIKDELEIISPDHKVFVEKWVVDGKFPAPDADNFAEFSTARNEFFGELAVIPFATPFNLGLIKDDAVVPTELIGLMEEVNEVIEKEMKENETPPATADTDKGPESPKANAN
jgi:hypothetical protein